MGERPGEFEKEALVASGVGGREELGGYLARVDCLVKRIVAEGVGEKRGELEKARALFQWLWRAKPKRYRRQGHFWLSEVIEAQLSPEAEEVGNCLGLTLLYNVLAQRLGLKVRAVYLDDAFGRGPHVFSVLYTAAGPVDIENIFADGFDYKGHVNNPGRVAWGGRELVAEVYLSEGNSLFEAGQLEAAIESYDKAIELNPGYARPRLNKGMALAQLGRLGEAGQWLSQTE